MSQKPPHIGINILDYNLKSNDWWNNRTGILLKTYRNISGEVIKAGAKIIIVKKIQIIRHYKFSNSERVLHHGRFAVKDFNFNEIIGVYCYDIVLKF